jgi:O-antigen/teichoic acid export membrane protein
MARLGRHTLVYGLASVLAKAISFVMLPVYTRYLSPADYGVMQLIDMTLDVISIIAGAQVALGIFRFFHKAVTNEDRRSIISTAFLMLALSYATVGCITLATSPFISRLVFHTTDYAHLIRIASTTLALQGLIAASMAYLRVRNRSLVYVGANFAKLVIGLAFNVIFLVGFGIGVRGVFYSSLIANVVVAAVLGTMLVRDVGLRFATPAARDLLRYGVPLIGTQFATFIVTFGDRYFLQGVSNITTVGIYSLAYQFGFLLASLGYMPFETVWAPARFEIAKRTDRDEVFSRGFIYMNLLLISAAVTLTLFINDILRVMATPPFYAAASLVPIILVAYVLQGWSGMQDIGILVRERTEFVTLGNWLSAVVALAGYALLIPRYQGLGAALATVLAFGVRYGSVYLFSQHLWPVRYRWMPVVRQIAIAVVICVVGLELPAVNIWLSLGSRALLLLLYAVGVWALVLSPDDRRAARALVARLWARPTQLFHPAHVLGGEGTLGRGRQP